MSAKLASRNPAGVVTSKPIALRLMPEELADAKRIASQHGLSSAALARKAFIAGLPLVEHPIEKA
jgi:hypothetical protein